MAALIREREHGTIEHLLQVPIAGSVPLFGLLIIPLQLLSGGVFFALALTRFRIMVTQMQV